MQERITLLVSSGNWLAMNKIMIMSNAMAATTAMQWQQQQQSTESNGSPRGSWIIRTTPLM
jgi:hypothetical protein